MEKYEGKSPILVELSQAEFENWSRLVSGGMVRHIAYHATLAEAHEIAADQGQDDLDIYRRELGHQAEIPAQRLVGADCLDPELMALSREDGADQLAAFRAAAPRLPELARWEAFQSPADRLPLESVNSAIAAAEAARGRLAGAWASRGYYAGFNYYLPVDEIRLEEALPSPPVPGSPEQAADLEVVRAARAERSEERIARVQADAEMSVFRFADVLGDRFNPEAAPFAEDLLRQAFIDGDNAVNRLKRAFSRPRPFIVDPDIETIVEQPPNASYPSGHSTFAHLNARLLARALPEYAEALMTRAEEYAGNRIVAGVHFPTDIEGGRRSAAAIDAALAADPVFAADFTCAREEIRKALSLPPIEPRSVGPDDQAENKVAC